MLSKITLAVLVFVLIGRVLFRRQLRELGQRLDRFVTLLTVVIFVSWALQLAWLLSFR